jgi:hypothetical protein
VYTTEAQDFFEPPAQSANAGKSKPEDADEASSDEDSGAQRSSGKNDEMEGAADGRSSLRSVRASRAKKPACYEDPQADGERDDDGNDAEMEVDNDTICNPEDIPLPLKKGAFLECSMVDGVGCPEEWHTGKVVSVNAKRQTLTVRVMVDGEIQDEKYTFSVCLLLPLLLSCPLLMCTRSCIFCMSMYPI